MNFRGILKLLLDMTTAHLKAKSGSTGEREYLRKSRFLSIRASYTKVDQAQYLLGMRHASVLD